VVSLCSTLTIGIVAYPSFLLLRYPSLRRATARELALYARRHPNPLTPRRPPGPFAPAPDAAFSFQTPHSRLVVLSGLDGSGKTTQLRWMSAALQRRGERHRVVWLRWVMLTSLPLVTYGRLRGFSRRRYNPRSQCTIVQPLYHRSRVMRSAWPCLFALDVALAAWWRVLWPWRRGEVVLCDRYVLDVIVDIAAIVQDDSFLQSRLASRLLALLPPDACTVVIDVDPEIAFDRKPDVLDLAYLERRRPLYLDLARHTGATIVDGNADVASVQRAIASTIGLSPPVPPRAAVPEAAT
jgi:thymidylate kinase